jgi:hypothetical protein
MERYEAPAVVATYSVDELVEEAATCELYGPVYSDRAVKEDVEGIEGALERVTSVRTR